MNDIEFTMFLLNDGQNCNIAMQLTTEAQADEAKNGSPNPFLWWLAGNAWTAAGYPRAAEYCEGRGE